MKTYKASDITAAVSAMYGRICCEIDSGACSALKAAEEKETSALSKFALSIMKENLEIAKKEHIAACQDTGMAVVFIKIGRDAHVEGNIEEAVNLGVRNAYKDYFRKSVLDPLTRVNTRDNTPAVIHYEITEGDALKISVMSKGFGSENMSRLFMLTPADGKEGIIRSAVTAVKESGGCACPPVIVGIGIGGTMEKAALLAKKSLLREIGSHNADPAIAALETEILNAVNSTRVGAQGLGGDTTALAVFIESYPTHIAGLPVAINMQCHCSRHASTMLEGKMI